MMETWDCELCRYQNDELAECCAGCGADHVTADCCNEMRSANRMHIVTVGAPAMCHACMSPEDYHSRIDRISNVFESNAWIAKHGEEILERPQSFVELVYSRFVDHHFALEDVESKSHE